MADQPVKRLAPGHMYEVAHGNRYLVLDAYSHVYLGNADPAKSDGRDLQVRFTLDHNPRDIGHILTWWPAPYKVEVNSDLTEGRGHMVTLGLFASKEEADKVAFGLGVGGIGNGSVTQISHPKVFETFEEWLESPEGKGYGKHHPYLNPKTKHYLSGMAKLTPEEMDALGVRVIK